MSKVIKLSAALAVLTAALIGPAQAEAPDTKYYSNQTPYGNPASTEIQTPPEGYEMLFIETIGRHGSRPNTSTAAETRALKVWNDAKKKGGLTSLGKQFSSEVTWFQKAERAVGYGNLTAVGKTEWKNIGRRTVDKYLPFFQNAKAEGETISFQTSSVFRTLQSYTEMRTGINATVPGLTYARSVKPFDLTSGVTTAGNAAIARAKANPTVRAAADHVLRKIYTSKYVSTLSDPVGKAMDIYLLYCTAPAMRGMTAINFARYVPLIDAKILGYFKDTENFYRFGPGIVGETSSYIKSKFVLDDFFTQLQTRINGGSTAAVFRLGHGETTMPFAALIGARGSEVQVAKPPAVFNYNNPWRGYIAGRPAGNIEWVAYRNGTDVLVTMRYNEEPVKFRSACTAADPTGYFYTVAMLKSCLPVGNPHG